MVLRVLTCHKKGGQIARRELTRNASTQVVVSTIAKRNGDQQVEVRQCTELKARLFELHKNPRLLSPPAKRKRNICLVHFTKGKNRYLKIRELCRPQAAVGLNAGK